MPDHAEPLILVFNAGSSSVKFGLYQFDSLEVLGSGLLDFSGGTDSHRATLTLSPRDQSPQRLELDAPDYGTGVRHALVALGTSGLVDKELRAVRAVGHRLIHGGEKIRTPVLIDAAMKETIRQFAHLAPLHIPAGLETIAACEAALPAAVQVGVFDTAFFADIPPVAYLYPVPYQWYQDWGIRRFGFHGTSHAYCTTQATEMLGRQADDSLCLVICHLGHGSSATAVRGGVAVTNTMGYTPLEGFMMGTRSGSVDPGILLHVLRERGMSVEQLDEALHKQSGLLGISGVSADFRRVELAAAEGNPRAQLALGMYAYRVRAMIGALAVTLGRIDGLVFTGGIGENSVLLRQDICQGLECIGVRLDLDRNATARPDADIAQDASAARVLLIRTREEYMIASQTRQTVESQEARAESQA
ncbi:MAG: acetate/propionate family kinase, partial [Rhodopirellula sp.]|nr:acetate/propionate family kinase [Rhodopirellula sp.]